jgi:hypothetical protein
MLFLIISISILSIDFVYGVRTTKGADLMLHEGYEYRKKTGDNAIIADGTIQVWMCPIKTCNGRLHTPVGSEVVLRIVTQHNHPPQTDTHVVSQNRKILFDNFYYKYVFLKFNIES